MILGKIIITSPHSDPTEYVVHGRNEKAKTVELWRNGKKPGTAFTVPFPITRKDLLLAPSQTLQFISVELLDQLDRLNS